MKKISFILLAALFPFLFMACDDQGTGDQGSSDLDTIRETPYEVEVLLNGVSKGKVDITRVADSAIIKEKVDDVDVYKTRIATVIQKSDATLADDETLKAFLEEYVCDYEAVEGFKPSDKSSCPPRPCISTLTAYLNLQTGRITYEENLGVGCYSVKGAKKIIMTTKPAQ
ncbi:MAG: hypothetical protein WC966_03125 [Bradymonadales bacterium]|jgi:hypothetical protein